MLVDGTWSDTWRPNDGDADGRFERKPSAFRDTVDPDTFEPGRYHLFVAWICPWAHRTLITRALKGLESTIPVHAVEPELTDQGWRFASGADPLHDSTWMWELYVHSDPHYTGRATVPVLWDTHTDRAVNNESSEIIRMLDALPSDAPRLAPDAWLSEIDAVNARMYDGLNNGVYRAGFAETQSAYDAAVDDVFATLHHFEEHLQGRDWLVGDRPTESDVRLFVTGIRFDAAYHGLFKCNRHRWADFPALQAHLERMYALPGVADTVRIDHIKRGYYSVRALNPSGVVPDGPVLPFVR